jgi:hypothetical protein
LILLALAIGALFSIGDHLIFAAALHRPVDLSEPDVIAVNAILAAIPFAFLAMSSSRRALPWVIVFAATVCLRWWWLSKGIAYQRASDGSGVDIGGALLMLVSPLPLTGLALAANLMFRRPTWVDSRRG